MSKQFGTLAVVAVALLLQGCANYKPVPEGHTGPVATIADSGFAESGMKAQIFALTEVNGNAIKSSFNATAGASYGHGLSLTTSIISRQVPATPMTLKLVASHVTGAPIHEIASRAAGTFFSVEGVVDFIPAPDGNYIVKGVLKKEGSSVWIEDVSTGQVVTQKITGT